MSEFWELLGDRGAGLVAFFNERVDLILDGEALPRAATPWSE